MIISESRWEMGPFVVRQAVRHDNPAFPCYMVFRGADLIGKSFSMPDLDCCRWLERQTLDELVYAASSAKLCDKGREHSMRGVEKARAYSRTARKYRSSLPEQEFQTIPQREEVT